MSINKNIKRIRQIQGITLEALAAKLSLTKGYLSKVENAKRSPPVSTLQSLAIALGVDISDFFDNITEQFLSSEDIEIVRGDDAAGQIEQSVATEEGYAYKPLVGNLKNKYMSPFLMIIKKGKTGVFSHDSEEFGHVISGKIKFKYKGNIFILESGDSFYFDSRKPHSIINEQKETAVVLAVNFNYRRF
ncbi:MAG: hypothetical protein A2Y13_07785 [Planctomycetes bacterium GWC2_45_44]|nr:MAG: hypothetical protein A2Y13_07785 [Planctomycetes bacterium GWC2_45_44]